MVFANTNRVQRIGPNNVREEKPQLELVLTTTPLYAVGEGVFDDQEHLERSRESRGFHSYVPPLKDMGYTPEILASLRSPKDISDRDLWP
jgi:hypothetical protein